ncbi:MAG: transporter [Proteobacteria bacterium]|nr:transporter [Pseudomonadota bacterium]
MLFATWGVHVPTVRQQFGLSEASLSWLMLAVCIGALISLTQVGGWVARHGARQVVLLGGLLIALPLAWLLWVPAYAMLLASLFLFGLASGAFDVAMNAEAVAVEQAYGRPIMSSFHGFFSLGGLTGALLGSLAAATHTVPWLHLGGSALIGFAMVWLASQHMLPLPAASATNEDQAGFRLPHGTILLLGLLAALGLIGEGAMYDWSTLYMVKELDSPQQIAALGYGAFSGAMAAGRFGGDWLRGRLGAARTLSLSAWIAAVAMSATLAIGHPLAALPGFALVGLGFSNMIPVLFSAAAKVPGVTAAHGIAGVSGVGYLGFMLGPPLIGAIAHATRLSIALLVVAVFSAIAALLTHRALRAASR